MNNTKIKMTEPMSLAIAAMNALLHGHILSSMVSQAQVLTTNNQWHLTGNRTNAELYIRKFSEETKLLRIGSVEAKTWNSYKGPLMVNFEFHLENRELKLSARLSVLLVSELPMKEIGEKESWEFGYPYGYWSVQTIFCYEHPNEHYSGKILLDSKSEMVGNDIKESLYKENN